MPFFNCLFHLRLLLQLTQLQQSSFALENNVEGQKEIDDKVTRLGFSENSLQLMTKVRGCVVVCKLLAICRLVEVSEPVQHKVPWHSPALINCARKQGNLAGAGCPGSVLPWTDSDTYIMLACVMQVYLCSAEILLPGMFRVVKFLIGLVFADASWLCVSWDADFISGIVDATEWITSMKWKWRLLWWSQQY